jgi:SNF2 family DNA or RNA helicase
MGAEANMTDCWSQWCESGWHSTGTPIPNDPIDVFTFLRFCGVMPMNAAGFARRYFDAIPKAFSARYTVKPDMVSELRALIDNNSIRRTKKSIGMQLPPIFLTTFLVEGDTTPVMQMLREYPGLENAIMSALDKGGLSFLDAQHVATLRRLIGEAKAVPYARLLLEELRFQPEAKRVVFGSHINALAYVRDFMNANGIKAVSIQGSTSEKNRVEAVRSFQNDPDCRVFIGNIKAAGVGLTLTAANDLDMLESDWTPAGNAQAIMRVHRIGQNKNVRARFITLAGSFDETVNRVVADKTAAIADIEGEAMIATPHLTGCD